MKVRFGNTDSLWRLYVDLCTRISTRELPDGSGKECEALDSLHGVFTHCRDFLMVLPESSAEKESYQAVVQLMENALRHFLAFWNNWRNSGLSTDKDVQDKFRGSLRDLQTKVRGYVSRIQEVENFPDLLSMSEEVK